MSFVSSLRLSDSFYTLNKETGFIQVLVDLRFITVTVKAVRRC